MSNELPYEVQKVLNTFTLKFDKYKKLMQILETEMNKGLKTATHDSADVKMYPSFVTKLPTGREEGQFLALDLGGTSFRVFLVTLTPNQKPVIIEKEYTILKERKCGTGEELFQFIAEKLNKFVEIHPVEKYPVKLGFTFSFPCDQNKLNDATLVRWTKGFSASGCEGGNVAELLQRQIDKLKLDVKCVAVVNDAVGTLMSCALYDPDCHVGVVVGTGTNASYVEDISRVETFKGDKTGLDFVVINMEWGALGEHESLNEFRTNFDKILDEKSLHAKQQIFEKMCSGMYLGELVRIVLVELIKKKLLFRGKLPEKLKTPYGFYTKYLSRIESDLGDQYDNTKAILIDDLHIAGIENMDIIIIRNVCETITNRAACLLGAAIACLINHLNKKEITVGIEGSLYERHPKIHERIQNIIEQLKEVDTTISIQLCKNGSGKGAAVIAALADQMN